jgi:catechol 2,3-dioxygenase-like lactoylglutathione lyase family enzyme
MDLGSEIPDLGVELPAIDQVAMVVEDLDDGMARFRAILGVEPWTVYRFEPPELTDTTYRGEEAEFGMLLAIGHAGDTMVELVEPTIGPNIYRDHLDEHGEGLHHVAYFGWDEAEAARVVESFEAAGMPVVQSGHYVGTDFWYFDSRTQLNGLTFEVVVRRDVEAREPERVWPGDEA